MDVSEAGEGSRPLGGAGRQDHSGPHLSRVYINPQVDRSEWSAGPWDDEPDKISWTDEETELPCLLVRNGMGAWCGYVAVEPGHPYWDRDYADVPASVHGGLTFSDFCRDDEAIEGAVCHVPEPGRPDNVFWFGFDAGHAFDLVPGFARLWRELGYTSRHEASYRTAAYMRSECENLARQLKEIEP